MLSFKRPIPSPKFGDIHYVDLSLKNTNNQIDHQCEAKDFFFNSEVYITTYSPHTSKHVIFFFFLNNIGPYSPFYLSA